MDKGGRARLGVSSTPPRHRSRRAIGGGRSAGLLVLCGGVGALIAYMVLRVPVVASKLPPSELHRHWLAAVVGVFVVVAVDDVFIWITMGRRAEAPAGVAGPGRRIPAAADQRAFIRIPGPLRWQRIRRRQLLATAGVAGTVALAALVSGFPLWAIALGALVPWVPALAWEGAWKYEHYGFYAVFLGIVAFQVAHMGEHVVQMLQLLGTHGDLARSHGVFGQLDLELVHFVFDSGVWLALGVLVCAFRAENRWLVFALVVASLHEVEHLYLFWLHVVHPDFYAQGGIAGIMGSGGLIGSPLARPYLHFSYNFIVVVPMVMALWDEAKRLSARPPARLVHERSTPIPRRRRANGTCTKTKAELYAEARQRNLPGRSKMRREELARALGQS